MMEMGENGPGPAVVLLGRRHGRAQGRALFLLDLGNLEAQTSENLWILAQRVRWGYPLQGVLGKQEEPVDPQLLQPSARE